MYSAQQLEIIDRTQEAAQHVLTNLMAAVENGITLSIAEEDFLGSWLYIAQTQSGERVSLHESPAFQNHLFKIIYLTYQGNFEGLRPVKNPLGYISTAEVVKDVALLERFYQDWLLVINNERHSERLLQYVGQESRNQLKNSNKFAHKLRYGSRLRKATEKSIVLHSKYFYYKVKKYFQELGADELVEDHCGYKIVIDGYMHFHVLFRHYARDTKPYQIDSSYHADQSIDPDILPTEIGIIINDYFDTVSCDSFDARRIYVMIRSILYVIWFRPMSQYKIGSHMESVLRVQTFYPVVMLNELDFVKTLREVVSKDGRVFFV